MTDWVSVSGDWGSDQVVQRDRQGFVKPASFTDVSLALDSQSDNSTKEITKRHWVSTDSCQECMNRSCRRKFTLIERPSHCRRCGKVFCSECVRFKRKLSFLANLDPEGKPYKVCQVCFEEGKDFEVQTRRLTDMFKCLKIKGAHSKNVEQNGQTTFSKSWKQRVDLSKECERLKTGFKTSIGTSEMKRTIQEMKTIIATPSWQKSSVWMQENMADKCQVCTKDFGLMRKKLNCKVCGQSLCKKCCREELLVYIPDMVENGSPPAPELAIIKIIGSPEVEPEISLLLHVCDQCRQFVVDCQVSDIESLQKSEVKEEDGVISKLLGVNDPITNLQTKIVFQLTKYQEIVESLENGSRRSADGSNTKSLAKAQVDLSDHFATFTMKAQVLKQLPAECKTETQRRHVKYYLKAKTDFYLDNVYTFRHLKKKLSESAPPEVLETIQNIVDKNAIVSAQIYIRQLIYENIALCQRHTLKENLPTLLTPLDQAIELEACQCLLTSGEDWEGHQQNVKEIVKSQLQGHRLIRPSKRLLATEGVNHAADIVLQRTRETLYQVMIQLKMKSLDRSFPKSKDALETSKKEAHLIQAVNLISSRKK